MYKGALSNEFFSRMTSNGLDGNTSNSLHSCTGDNLGSNLHLHFHLCWFYGIGASTSTYSNSEKMDHRSRGKQECRQKNEANKLIKDQSEWHCTPSGRFLGNGTAVTYLWGTGLWLFVAPASEDDEVSAPSACPRPWNLANRFMTDIFSRSWFSILKSTNDAPLSNLHHRN